MKTIAADSAVAALMLGPLQGLAQGTRPDLARIADSKAWTLSYASAETSVRDGRRLLRLVAAGDSANGTVGLAEPQGLVFKNGTLEIELKGKNVRQNSFLGVAFNVLDERTFEAIYFRPFNFRADAPISGRSVQYLAWPTYTWEHLRKTQPGRFESAVTPVPDPDGWFHATVEVTDSLVRVFVNRARQPSLVVQRLAVGGAPRPVALFVDSSDGHYADFMVTADKVLPPSCGSSVPDTHRVPKPQRAWR